MKKKIVLGLILGFLAAAVGAMGYYIQKTHREKTAAMEELFALPDFTFYTLDNQPFTKQDLTSQHHLLLIYFNPDCEHCLTLIKEVVENIEKFPETDILLVSFVEVERLQTFAEQLAIGDYPQMVLLKEKEEEFFHKFGYSSVPTSVMYDQNKEFLGHFEGEVIADALIRNLYHPS